MEEQELELIKVKRTTRVKKENKEMKENKSFDYRSITLRPIKWNHVLGLKPRKEDIVAVKYELKDGSHFTTRFNDYPEDKQLLETDKVTYINKFDESGKYFQLSFYPSNQKQNEFDTMALIGERGEVIYLYEF